MGEKRNRIDTIHAMQKLSVRVCSVSSQSTCIEWD
jgi:hypothetical protein